MVPARVPLSFKPETPRELLDACKDMRWRLFSGFLYKIMTKDDENQEGSVVPFKPNAAQRRQMLDLHYRSIILKARQLGMTTLAAILWLDHAMFCADQRCGIIAHSREDAEVIFRDKVKFAYNNLPPELKRLFPLKRDSASELLFAHNNSSVRVAVSMRSGTIHRLHISEMGKIAAKHPEKAREIVTGSLPAVPKTGIAVIESTAEGEEGEFYDIATKAEERGKDQLTPLTLMEWRFHFYPWYIEPGYVADPASVKISPEQHEYFDGVEVEMGVTLSLPQRAWWVSKLNSEMSGDAQKMWQEYPSTPEECWKRSTEGTFYAPQLANARAEGRITIIPHVKHVHVHTFWDIGAGDGTGIWAMQHVGVRHRFIRYFEDWAQGYEHYVNELRATGWLFGVHYLPHDAMHQRQMENRVASPMEILQELAPDWNFTIVPRVQTLQQGIDMTRAKFPEAWFDEDGCEEGLRHVALYHKKWNARLGRWSHEPEKLDGHSEAADALRQWAQGFDPKLHTFPSRPSNRKRPRGGM
ncbi:terminase [Thioclava dalianensis]|uniref:Terminase n=1 Tax=Thioclava dalianensis TaxID=1185766 RepID=A0A074TAT4_9RHOB|nr:terminase [Thioclava dalianensis]